jgi:hypothetical protein
VPASPPPTVAAAAAAAASSSSSTYADPGRTNTTNHNDDDDDDDDALCMICLDDVRSMALLHQGLVHLCMCRRCCAAYDMTRGCPKCRRPVEQIIDVEQGVATEL